MGYSNIIASSKNSLKELDSLVIAIECEVISGNHGIELITNNVNFFTKSFLITLCAHLETCIKDIVFSVAEDIDFRLSNAGIPLAIVDWRYNQKNKNNIKDGLIKDNLSSVCIIKLSKKEVDDLVSGNVYRTKDSFLIVGIDLASDKAEWEEWKELIQSIVTRRNNIVHHNDAASDLSFGDIRVYIKSVEDYLDFIHRACVAANNALSQTSPVGG
jgi:RiboL-PSP-HEPN